MRERERERERACERAKESERLFVLRESQTVEILKVKFNMKLAITTRTGAATAERPEARQTVRKT